MDIAKHLKNAVVVRELDLTDLDDAYRDRAGNPLRLLYRVNPSRGQTLHQYELAHEYSELQKLVERDTTPEEDAAAAVTLRALRQREFKWWATMLLVDEKAGSDLLWRWFGWLMRALGKERQQTRRYLKPKELAEIRESSQPVWNWLTTTVLTRIRQYEVDLVKKAHDAPTPAT